MDHPEPSLVSRKTELIRALHRSRRAMEAGVDEVASVLDFQGQFRASFASSSWQWLAAALAAGVVSGIAMASLSKHPILETPAAGKSPLAGRIAKTLLRGALESFAKPALQSLLQGKGEKWLWRILDKSGS